VSRHWPNHLDLEASRLWSFALRTVLPSPWMDITPPTSTTTLPRSVTLATQPAYPQ
jgi:hypothetical protein